MNYKDKFTQQIDLKEAIAEIAQLRQNVPSASRQSPETRSQRALVLAWKKTYREHN